MGSAVAGAAPFVPSAHGFSTPAAAVCGLPPSASSNDGSAGRGSTAPGPSTVRPATFPSTYTDKPNRPAGPFSRSKATKPCSRKTRRALGRRTGVDLEQFSHPAGRGVGYEPPVLGDGVEGDLFQGHPRQRT